MTGEDEAATGTGDVATGETAMGAEGTASGRTSVWDRAERPRRGGNALDRDQIVRAAIALIDDEGPDALSMRRLATRMGVGAMSLYWHVERKADLMDLVADAIFGELDLPEPSGDWRADLRLIATRTRALFLRHPWLLQAMLSSPGPSHFGPNFLRHVDFTFASLVRLGIPLRELIAIAGTLDSYVFGSVLHRTVAGGVELDAAGQADLDRQFRAALSRGDYPALHRLQDAFADMRDVEPTEERQFLFGLDAVLDGLAGRVASLATDATDPAAAPYTSHGGTDIAPPPTGGDQP